MTDTQKEPLPVCPLCRVPMEVCNADFGGFYFGCPNEDHPAFFDTKEALIEAWKNTPQAALQARVEGLSELCRQSAAMLEDICDNAGYLGVPQKHVDDFVETINATLNNKGEV